MARKETVSSRGVLSPQGVDIKPCFFEPPIQGAPVCPNAAGHFCDVAVTLFPDPQQLFFFFLRALNYETPHRKFLTQKQNSNQKQSTEVDFLILS